MAGPAASSKRIPDPVEKVRSYHFRRAIPTEAVLHSSVHGILGLNLENERFWRLAHKLSTGITTIVSGKIQLKLEFVDSYKNKPPNSIVKKNDTALVTTFVVKF
jgi:hypothetical protein